jgi:hypothetical protein
MYQKAADGTLSDAPSFSKDTLSDSPMFGRADDEQHPRASQRPVRHLGTARPARHRRGQTFAGGENPSPSF